MIIWQEKTANRSRNENKNKPAKNNIKEEGSGMQKMVEIKSDIGRY
jgi:hypothetical protein